MIDLTPETISSYFAEYARDATHQRARDILVALVEHLHAFIIETGLTHEEWRSGLDALTRAGEMLTPERNEFVLFSDMLGISSLVDMLHSPQGATSSSVLGPFHQQSAPPLKNGGDLWRGQLGEVLVLEGRVVDAITGSSVTGASLDLSQNANNGLYAAQDPDQPAQNYHGLLDCGEEGNFAFTTTRFKPYEVPVDGPAGDMLRLLGRSAWRPAHLHLIAQAPGYRTLVTELFPSDDEWLTKDAAFGVRDDLVLEFEKSSDHDGLPEILEAREKLPEEFLRAKFDIRLYPELGE